MDVNEAEDEYGINMLDKIENDKYDGIILCVAHQKFFRNGHKNQIIWKKRSCIF